MDDGESCWPKEMGQKYAHTRKREYVLGCGESSEDKEVTSA